MNITAAILLKTGNVTKAITAHTWCEDMNGIHETKGGLSLKEQTHGSWVWSCRMQFLPTCNSHLVSHDALAL